MKKLILVAAVLIFASSASAEICYRTAQGPDEWLPGVVTTTLPTTGAAGTARVLQNRINVTLELPSAAAGDCFATFDAATLTSTGARGFKITRGDVPRSIDIGSAPALRVVCTAQLVTPNGLKVFQCH